MVTWWLNVRQTGMALNLQKLKSVVDLAPRDKTKDLKRSAMREWSG